MKILKKLFCTIFIFFINIANTFANEEIYYIPSNEVYLENTGNVLELRESAKLISFQKALNILAKNILDPEDFLRFGQISDYNVTNLISDYKVESEKISDINYSAVISVNFNELKVREFLNKNEIKLNIFVSESYLIFPIYKKFNTFYLWDKDNFWYDSLLAEYDQQSLLKLFFPKKSHINRLKISAEQIISKDLDKINKFLAFYNKKKAIIIFLEESFEMRENAFKSDVRATLYSANEFSIIQLSDDNHLSEGTTSQIELIAKLVVNDLQNWWKNRIDLGDDNDNNQDLILISVDTEDFKKSFLIEQIIYEIFGVNNTKIKEIAEQNTIYEIKTNLNISHINLGLESKNLKLIENNNEKNLFKIENY